MYQKLESVDRGSTDIVAREIEENFGAHGLEKNLTIEDLYIEMEEPEGTLETLSSGYHKLNHIFLEKDDSGFPENVIKVYPETRVNTREEDWFWAEENPVDNSVKASRENPDLFPDTEKIGAGILYTDKDEYGIGVLKQEYLPYAEGKTLRNSLEEGQYEKDSMKEILAKWTEMIERHREDLDSEDKKILDTEIPRERESDEVRRRYHERFPSLQFDYVMGRLEDFDIETEDLSDLKIEKSKILGDFAPRQILRGGTDYLSFDLDRYGVGEPYKDLGFLLETIDRKIGKEEAEKVAKDLESISTDEKFLKKMKRSILGYRGEKFLNGPERKKGRNLRLLERDIDFYGKLK